jgi:hypothetical protein
MNFGIKKKNNKLNCNEIIEFKDKINENPDNQSEAVTRSLYPKTNSLSPSQLCASAWSARVKHAPDFSKIATYACPPLQNSTVLNCFIFSLCQLNFNRTIEVVSCVEIHYWKIMGPLVLTFF